MGTQWHQNPTTSYADYFSRQRPVPFPDNCRSITLSEQYNAIQGDITQTVTFLDTNTLSHKLSDTATLDIQFVEQVLSSSGPIVRTVVEQANWQWVNPPSEVPDSAFCEADYYSWLMWVVFRPAVNAVAAVRDQLYTAANIAVPSNIGGDTKTRLTNMTTPRGVTDILGIVGGTEFMPHEIKRSRVVPDVLPELVKMAKLPRGFLFRDAEDGLKDKARRLICQVSGFA